MPDDTPSRFSIPVESQELDLPAGLSASAGHDIEQIAKEICQHDPELAEILFSATFSNKTREERRAAINSWGK